MPKKLQEQSVDPNGTIEGWKQDWIHDLRYFHTSEKELSPLIEGGDLTRRAVSHLRLCATCREALAFRIEGVVLDRPSPREQLDALMHFLKHRESVVRAAAARAVVSLAEEVPSAVEPLRNLLEHEDETVRHDAAFAWDQVFVPQVVSVLFYWMARRYARRTFERRRLAGQVWPPGGHVPVNMLAPHQYRWPVTWLDQPGEGNEPNPAGPVWVILDTAAHGRTLTLDTTRSAMDGQLVRCELVDATGSDDPGAPAALVVWLVLHADPISKHAMATARLSDDVALPYECVPAPCVAREVLPEKVMLEAVRSAHTQADHEAWTSWIRGQVRLGLLPEGVLTRIPSWAE